MLASLAGRKALVKDRDWTVKRPLALAPRMAKQAHAALVSIVHSVLRA